MLNLGDDAKFWAMVGAGLPDLDLYIGKHRKTLHNEKLVVLAGFLPDEEARTAFLVGIASHLVTDKLSRHIKASRQMIRLVQRMAEL